MTNTERPPLRALTRSLIEKMAALAEDYPTDGGEAPTARLHATVAGQYVGAARLMPGQVDWLRGLVAAELATTREAHPGGSGACMHCEGTGTGTAPSRRDSAPKPVATVYVAEAITWDGSNPLNSLEHIAARTSLGSVLDALREDPDYGGDLVATEVAAEEYFRADRAWAVHERDAQPASAYDDIWRVITALDVHP